jgi:cation transport ATPase
MKKNFKMQDLDCANCAAKMQDAISKIEGVKSANINFMSQKLTIEAEESEFDSIMKQAVKACKKIEPDCTILI